MMLDYVTKLASDLHYKLFGELPRNCTNRAYRFLEEAIELCQSLDVPKDEVYHLVASVYSKPVGKPYQELGGVMVTLPILASSMGYFLTDAFMDEYVRCNAPNVFCEIQRKGMDKNGLSRS